MGTTGRAGMGAGNGMAEMGGRDAALAAAPVVPAVGTGDVDLRRLVPTVCIVMDGDASVA